MSTDTGLTKYLVLELPVQISTSCSCIACPNRYLVLELPVQILVPCSCIANVKFPIFLVRRHNYVFSNHGILGAGSLNQTWTCCFIDMFKEIQCHGNSFILWKLAKLLHNKKKKLLNSKLKLYLTQICIIITFYKILKPMSWC